ncbi:MAG: RNA pseudouridine synthase [Candidatus Aureabacteria bacterium]|nr:RNA pseudouridine synthase [Candidatus Auribacterota bacterium]
MANKPSGLLSVPSPKNGKNTLSFILPRQLQESNILPCHRLDKETSGIMIFARGKKARDKMFELFKNHEIIKIYIAFIHGIPQKKSGTISSKISEKTAITKYKTRKILENFSILGIQTVTGRRNQIRIHFKLIKHPLVGERKFAFGKDFKLKFKRCALHASRIEFKHPYSGRNLTIEVPLPEDMSKFLEKQKLKMKSNKENNIPQRHKERKGRLKN